MLPPASMLKKPFTRAWLQIVLSCPPGFYFHSPAELTMYALLFISSTYRETRCPPGCISEFLLSFWLSLTHPPPPPPLLSTHLHLSVLYISLFYPDCTALAKPVHTNQTCAHIQADFPNKPNSQALHPPSCSEDHCSSTVAEIDAALVI